MRIFYYKILPRFLTLSLVRLYEFCIVTQTARIYFSADRSEKQVGTKKIEDMIRNLSYENKYRLVKKYSIEVIDMNLIGYETNKRKDIF